MTTGHRRRSPTHPTLLLLLVATVPCEVGGFAPARRRGGSRDSTVVGVLEKQRPEQKQKQDWRSVAGFSSSPPPPTTTAVAVLDGAVKEEGETARCGHCMLSLPLAWSLSLPLAWLSFASILVVSDDEAEDFPTLVDNERFDDSLVIFLLLQPGEVLRPR